MGGEVKFTMHVLGRGNAKICGLLLIRSCFISLYCSYTFITSAWLMLAWSPEERNPASHVGLKQEKVNLATTA